MPQYLVSVHHPVYGSL